MDIKEKMWSGVITRLYAFPRDLEMKVRCDVKLPDTQNSLIRDGY
ncbi:hypothetical protein FIU95_12990 [Microbulbifer sp. THAF38]|nr:hypothetical protein FIU95_12990 [Microbulbifer sp. THAF38]